MPSRIIPFVNGQIYHIYNRGTEKRRVFESRKDYQRLLKTFRYYQIEGPKPKYSRFYNSVFKLDPFKKIIAILAYCLMPNHIHVLAKQLKDGGITEFMSKCANSYTKYYNTKHNRIGVLFQGEFKATLIENDAQLVHVSRYIHLNPLVAYLVKDSRDFEWSSYNDYINNINGLCTKEDVMGYFKSPKDYEQFVLDQASYAQELGFIKHHLLDIEA